MKPSNITKQIVRDVILQWDPFNLLKNGAAQSEFDEEISAIDSRISEIHSEQDAIKIISESFTPGFEPGLFSKEICSDVGRTLYRRLQNLAW